MKHQSHDIDVDSSIDVDGISADDFGQDGVRGDVPRVIPDHGRQPRRPKRPTLVVYSRDPYNLYKPVDNAFTETSGDWQSQYDLGKTDIARMLARTAREHARRLSQRPDHVISDIIDVELLRDARFVASSLPKSDIPKILTRFVEVLWDEIALNRKKPTVSRRRD